MHPFHLRDALHVLILHVLHAKVNPVLHCRQRTSERQPQIASIDKKLCACRWTARRVSHYTTVWISCTTNPQQVEVMELRHYVDGRVINYRRCGQQPRSSTHVVDNMINFPGAFLSRPTEFGVKSEEVPLFWRHSNFLITQHRRSGRKPSCYQKSTWSV